MAAAKKVPLRKTNFLVGLVFLVASVACWKQGNDAAGWAGPTILYFASVFMFVISWGPFSVAVGQTAKHRR